MKVRSDGSWPSLVPLASVVHSCCVPWSALHTESLLTGTVHRIAPLAPLPMSSWTYSLVHQSPLSPPTSHLPTDAGVESRCLCCKDTTLSHSVPPEARDPSPGKVVIMTSSLRPPEFPIRMYGVRGLRPDREMPRRTYSGLHPPPVPLADPKPFLYPVLQ